MRSLKMRSDKPHPFRVQPIVITLAAIFVLAGIGYIYQSIAAQRDLIAHPPPGELIDVGGYRLHLYCLGDGSPTIILIHGLGGNVYHWAKIQPALARITRVCAYDRAGYGWSDVGPRPRSPLQNAIELHTLLENTGIKDALILVGHSYGTNEAQVYADQYPDDVQGLVLIDGGIATEVTKQCSSLNCMPPSAYTGTEMFLSLQPVFFRLGIKRLFNFPQPFGDNLKFLSLEQRDALIAGYGQTRSAETNLAEWQDWDNTIGQVGQPMSLKDTTVRVLMADERLPDWSYGNDPEKWRGYEQALLKELTQLSSDSQVTIIPNSDHASMLFDQNQWQYVVTAVSELIELKRSR
jgi:pimeloyl-ACP methyl ester carboxylesterase